MRTARSRVDARRRADTVFPVADGPDPRADWWTTSDVAAYLGVSMSTVSTYRARGQMPPPDQTLGRTRLWRPKRIVEWHKKRPGHGGRPPQADKPG